MLLSRFWYVLLGLVVGALVFVLYLADSMYNRQGAKAMAEGLSNDSQFVSWYLKNDARERSAHLIKFAMDSSIPKALADSSASEAKVPEKARTTALAGLNKVSATIPKDQSFDAIFLVDQYGRVVAHTGYEQANGMDDFELGGYPVVADALHGFIRDETLVLDRVYRVVARPVEYDLGSAPAGAVVGARIIDDRFARELSERTGSAVAFYSGGIRIASGAPEGFDRSQLDMIITDLKDVESDPDYKSKGRSSVRQINESLGVVYSRLPGEAWSLGAGYVVGRNVLSVRTPVGFFGAADDKDKSGVPIVIVIAIALIAMGIGLGLSWLEHTKPLAQFRDDVQKLAKGQSDAMQPSRYRGVYRTIASDVNDGIDVAAAKTGGTRRAADLTQVLGDLPAEPQMSAFSFPGDDSASKPKPAPPPAPAAMPAPPPRAPGSAPRPAVVAEAAVGAQQEVAEAPRRLPGKPPKAPAATGAAPMAAAAAAQQPSGDPQNAEWLNVYEEFAATKQRCGESLDGFTFDKFQSTLKKHRDAIVERHGVRRVKFSVYIKEGKAALKASPIKD
ncbi:MAG TPA: MXAN_5187 family protein [Polyangiaceae bacterium]|nr:MXAN_5187 family protein [Polyangiaceae bacterium]